MDKAFLVSQLAAKLQIAAERALRFADESRTEAKSGAARAVNLAKGTSLRSEAALAAVDAVSNFKVGHMRRGDRIGLGAIVEIEDGDAGKTLFIAPAGAGEELTGPDGDGYLNVVTPASPLGASLIGKRVGDVVEVMIEGELAEWEIVFAE
jgi:transcription elongation GreA/GreB family factor